MDEVWLAKENIRRFRSQLAEACDEGRRTILETLLQRELNHLRTLTGVCLAKGGHAPRSSDRIE